MKIEIKKTNLILAVFVTLFFVAFASASPNPGHDAEEVGPGTFSSGDYKFPGNVNIMNSLFMPTDAKGIFWATSSQDVSKPHIDYSSTTGLWISTGATGTNINIEGGNLVVDEGITLGGTTRNTWPESLDVPAGFCIFSDTKTSCPEGWMRRTTFDGRTIRGSSTPGGTGGSDTHRHYMWDSIRLDKGSHHTTEKQWTGYASSWPPYMNVIICCKDSDIVETSPEMPAAQLMASECPVGEYMAGINPDGTLICKELKITHTIADVTRWRFDQVGEYENVYTAPKSGMIMIIFKGSDSNGDAGIHDYSLSVNGAHADFGRNTINRGEGHQQPTPTLIHTQNVAKNEQLTIKVTRTGTYASIRHASILILNFG